MNPILKYEGVWTLKRYTLKTANFVSLFKICSILFKFTIYSDSTQRVSDKKGRKSKCLNEPEI